MSSNILPDWLVTVQNALPGESGAEHFARCVKAFDGVSLLHEPDKLTSLFLINEVDWNHAKQASAIQTSCATSFRCFLALAGCAHRLATCPYQSGMAVSWVIQIASDSGALINVQNDADAWKRLKPGYGIHFGQPGSTNDHLETILSYPDANGIALHGGGGRSNSLISVDTSDITHSWGRRIMHIIDTDKLCPPGPDLMIDPTAPLDSVSFYNPNDPNEKPIDNAAELFQNITDSWKRF